MPCIQVSDTRGRLDRRDSCVLRYAKDAVEPSMHVITAVCPLGRPVIEHLCHQTCAYRQVLNPFEKLGIDIVSSFYPIALLSNISATTC